MPKGYSRAMNENEERAHAALQASRRIFQRLIERHDGQIANTAGDGLIADFPSAVEAVQCAVEIQRELRAAAREPGGALRFRIGIHLGDVIVDGRDLLGEGVNLAARLQSTAQPGGILISRQVYDQVHSKIRVGFDYLGERHLKNYDHDVPIFTVTDGNPRQHRFWSARKRPSPPPPDPAIQPPPEDRATHAKRFAQTLGAIWAMLLVMDLTTGSHLWAHWPGLAFALIAALYAAPALAVGWFNVQFVRYAAIVAFLVAINIVTWNGTAWVIWPAAGLVILAALRRMKAGA